MTILIDDPFDDENLDVIMDVKINDQWKRIRPSEAINAKKYTPTLTSMPLEMLSANISDFFAPDPNDQTM